MPRLLREVASLTAPHWEAGAQAEGRPIALVVDAPDEPEVMGYATSLREALTNLVFNAVDALPEGGRIGLAARAAGDVAVLSVTDSGTGIPPSVQDRMFDPFFTTKGERGTGLGLSVVYDVVRRHEGTIDVESGPGLGTRIELRLPIGESQSPAPGPNAPSPADEAPRPVRILVVDDETDLLAAIARVLRKDGHLVTAVGSGREALAALEAESFDAVLSDLALGGGINGWDLAAVVRRRWPETRFALATGFGAAIDADDARL